MRVEHAALAVSPADDRCCDPAMFCDSVDKHAVILVHARLHVLSCIRAERRERAALGFVLAGLDQGRADAGALESLGYVVLVCGNDVDRTG